MKISGFESISLHAERHSAVTAPSTAEEGTELKLQRGWKPKGSKEGWLEFLGLISVGTHTQIYLYNIYILYTFIYIQYILLNVSYIYMDTHIYMQ